MSRVKMPKNRQEFEDRLMDAFRSGMISGYAVDHEHLFDDETVLENRYKACIQGKIDSMTKYYNGEMTCCERISEGVEENE